MAQFRRQSRRSRAAPRRRLTLAGVAALLVLGIAAASLWLLAPTDTIATDPAAPGRLVADQTTVDLGRVPLDKRAEARFELANTGGETVRLTGAPRVRMLEGC